MASAAFWLWLAASRDLFSHARVNSLAEIAQHFEEVRVEPATRLWREGDSASWLLVVLDGRVEAGASRGVPVSWTPGMVAGGLEAIARVPRWCDAAAVKPVTGLRLSADRFLDAVEDDFSMTEDLLASQLRQLRYG